MPSNSKKSSTTKNKAGKTSVSKPRNKDKYQSKGEYDKPVNLVIGGFLGLLISYVIISRALNTGSYWEYFFGLAFLILAIRLFIRSIRLK